MPRRIGVGAPTWLLKQFSLLQFVAFTRVQRAQREKLHRAQWCDLRVAGQRGQEQCAGQRVEQGGVIVPAMRRAIPRAEFVELRGQTGHLHERFQATGFQIPLAKSYCHMSL